MYVFMHTKDNFSLLHTHTPACSCPAEVLGLGFETLCLAGVSTHSLRGASGALLVVLSWWRLSLLGVWCAEPIISL